MKILFMCEANKFRSKVAEILFKKYNKNKSIRVKSAGINPVKPASKEIINKLKREFGIKKIDIKPVKVNKNLVDWADLIIITADNVNIKFPNKKVIIWKIPDTTEENYEEIVRIIKIIECKVKKLIGEVANHQNINRGEIVQ